MNILVYSSLKYLCFYIPRVLARVRIHTDTYIPGAGATGGHAVRVLARDWLLFQSQQRGSESQGRGKGHYSCVLDDVFQIPNIIFMITCLRDGAMNFRWADVFLDD